MANAYQFNENVIDAIFDDWQGSIIKTIINRLSYIGDAFVVNARGNNTYKDDTGNLRASIGFIIFYNGEPVNTAFPGTDKNGQSHETGKSKGIELAQDIADQYPQGFVLVCVAGMNYAAIVESKGYDVITNAAIEAEQDLRKAVEELNQTISKRNAGRQQL